MGRTRLVKPRLCSPGKAKALCQFRLRHAGQHQESRVLETFIRHGKSCLGCEGCVEPGFLNETHCFLGVVLTGLAVGICKRCNGSVDPCLETSFVVDDFPTLNCK